MNPIHITINVPDSQQKQLPAATPVVHHPVRSQLPHTELMEPDESVGVLTVSLSGSRFEMLRGAIVSVCLIAASALSVRMILKPKPEPRLTQAQVEALLLQEKARWRAEQQQLEHQRLEAEYRGFRQGVVYGQP